jgi:hypothetical protein
MATAPPLPQDHPNTVNALRNKRSEIVGDIDLRRRGHVQKIGDGIGVRWKLVPTEPDLI